jgi:hypothetical protein
MVKFDIDHLIKITNKGKEPVNAKNHPLYPQHVGGLGSFRWLITGRAGRGKTTLVIKCLMEGSIKFDHLYLYVRDPTQPKYQLLIKWLNSLQDEFNEKVENGEIQAPESDSESSEEDRKWLGEKEEKYMNIKDKKPIKEKGKVELYTVITDPEKIVPIDKINSEIVNVVIFDDMILEKNQQLVIEYFVRGRHRCANCVYITQSYHLTDITIRKNCDYFSVFGVSSKSELVQLCKDLSLMYDYHEFKDILTEATKGKNDFLFIDTRTDLDILKLRKGFEDVWDPASNSFIPIGKLVTPFNDEQYDNYGHSKRAFCRKINDDNDINTYATQEDSDSEEDR